MAKFPHGKIFRPSLPQNFFCDFRRKYSLLFPLKYFFFSFLVDRATGKLQQSARCYFRTKMEKGGDKIYSYSTRVLDLQKIHRYFLFLSGVCAPFMLRCVGTRNLYVDTKHVLLILPPGQIIVSCMFKYLTESFTFFMA